MPLFDLNDPLNDETLSVTVVCLINTTALNSNKDDLPTLVKLLVTFICNLYHHSWFWCFVSETYYFTVFVTFNNTV